MNLAQKMKLFLISGKSRWILLDALVLAMACLAIPKISLAQSWYNFLNPATFFPALLTELLKLLLLLADNLMQLVTWLLNWVVRNPFGISYTRPGLQAPDNFIIEIGWTLLRDLVNMGFILGLVYIGLATALDLHIGNNKFATGKTFRNLIIIALIVNFTPAICGAVVDMGNILGSFFTQNADFQSIHEIFERASKDLSRDWKDIFTQGTLLLQTVLLIGFGFFAALILGIYALLFLARGPIIWILVILSPVAFFAYIFDQTRKQFGLWWNIFLQWALIMPVILGFFLYLSQQILIRANEVLKISGAVGGEGMGGVINKVLPYTLPLGFLAMGLIIGAGKLMPAGGGAIMGVAKAGGVAALGAAGAGAAFAGKKAASGAASGARAGATAVQNAWQRKTGGALKPGEEGYEQWANKNKINKIRAGVNKAGRYMFGGESDKERGNWSGGAKWTRLAVRTAGTVATAGAPIWGRRLARKIGTAIDVNERTNEEVDERTKKHKDKTQKQLKTVINNALPGLLGRIERLSGILAAIDKGYDLKDFNFPKYQIKNIIEDAIKYAPNKMSTIKNIDPLLTAEIVNDIKPSERFKKQFGLDMDDEDKEKYGKKEYKHKVKEKDAQGNEVEVEKTIDLLAVKLMAEIKANKMNAWTKDIANDAVASDIANDFWDGGRVAKAAELFGSKFVNKFNEYAKDKDYYEKNNKPMGKYVGSQAGAAVGVEYGEKTPDRPDLMYQIYPEIYDANVTAAQSTVNPATRANYTLDEAKEFVKLNMTLDQAKKMGAEDFSKIDFNQLLDPTGINDPKAAAAILLGADPDKLKKMGETANTTQKKAIKKMVDDALTPGTSIAGDWLRAKMEAVSIAASASGASSDEIAELAKIQNIVNTIYTDPNFQ